MQTKIGISNFRDLKENGYYVDKTDFIDEILDRGNGLAYLITRPRRFGKSLMLSMLQSYFDFKEDSKKIFSDLKISKSPNFSCINSSPVIYFSLKDAAGSSDDILKRTKDLIIENYKKYPELLSSNYLDKDEISYCNGVINGKLNDDDYISSLYKLSKFIYKHHNKKAYLFIDEYDAPIEYAYENNFYDEIEDFYKRLYKETIKDNNYLSLSVITGVLSFAKDSLLSGLNNMQVDNGVNYLFEKEYFGFNEENIKQIAKDFNLNEENIKTMEEWYGGYRYSEPTFNPWSIINYASRKRIGTYWANTTSNVVLDKLISSNYVFDIIYRIINKEDVNLLIDYSVSYKDLDRSEMHIIPYLISTGYLTADINPLNLNSKILIPNKEVEHIIENEITNRYRDNNSNDFMKMAILKDCIINGDDQGFANIIKNYLSNLSYYDDSEKVYQTLILTITIILFNECVVKSEVNSNLGRCDILISPKYPNDFGAVIEIKHSKYRMTKEYSLKLLDKALNQIKENNYAVELYQRNAKPMLAYGVVFYKNNVFIKSEKLN